ncbi:MAG TPA: zinc-dependent metalloprotease [Gemmatimonadaceae bacterium]|nr:zinc-dependent metalloprotease [Gemmatimonadaceae bacterium]
MKRPLYVSAAAVLLVACHASSTKTAPAPSPSSKAPAAQPTQPPPQTLPTRPPTQPPTQPPRPDSAAPGGAAPGGLPAGANPLAGGGTPGCPPAAAPALGTAEPNPRPYAAIVTPRAKSKTGIFTVHQICSRLFFEIPAKELGKDFVITSVLAATPAGIGINGTLAPGGVIRFERRENRILIRDINYNNVASDTSRSGSKAMSMIDFFPIMASFNVEAYHGPDSAAVIDVTRMFTGGVPEFTAGGRRAVVDASRSYIDKFSAFARNVNVTAVQTYTGGAAAPGLPVGGPAGATTEAYTFSIVKLPDVPMQPRFFDARVGFFGEFKTDFGSAEQRVMQRRYIARWRLECSDQKVNNLCVPKKPITYYVDPATPAWLQPWIKRGIEEWQVAFEDAGFYKGIVAKDAPNDPEFSGEDASVAMVRWLPSAVANAVGPSTTDPRTGEIIDADVQMYENVMDLQRNWYFSQVGHLDPRAQKFPFPDSLMGRLIEFVVAHEVGHTLGFPHNFKGSSLYPLDSLRSKTWIAKMGHSPSIMDYARFNYVAQPEDHIALEDLVPRVGPYDRYAVMWGYKPIANAKTPEDERAQLDEWARMQDKTPWLRFANDGGAAGADPGEQSEAIGDADPVRATRLGFANIKRIMKLVEPASTLGGPMTDFSLLRSTYNAVVSQWATEANHVAKTVGAEDKQEKAVTQTGPVWTPVSKARQQEAMKFLNDEVFKTPAYLTDPTLLRKFESDGNINRIANAQGRALQSLLANNKLERMVELEALATSKSDAYTVGEMLTDLRKGLFAEIYGGKSVDVYRRRLQNVYLEQMEQKVNPPTPQLPAGLPPGIVLGGGAAATRDFRALVKDELRLLDRELADAIAHTTDRTTKAHLVDMRDQITKTLKLKDENVNDR